MLPNSVLFFFSSDVVYCLGISNKFSNNVALCKFWHLLFFALNFCWRQAVKQSIQQQNTEVWANKMKLWLEEMPLSQWPYSFDENILENEQKVDQFSEEDLPIWLAAQRAVDRYEGILSSLGPRSRLLRKFLTWMELIPSMPKRPSQLEPNVNIVESHLRYVSIENLPFL